MCIADDDPASNDAARVPKATCSYTRKQPQQHRRWLMQAMQRTCTHCSGCSLHHCLQQRLRWGPASQAGKVHPQPHEGLRRVSIGWAQRRKHPQCSTLHASQA